MPLTKYEYPCITFKQRKRGPQLCMFYASAKEIAEWAKADPLSDTNQDGHQRILNDYRVKAVDKFFKADPKNTIPTAVIIGLNQEMVKVDEGTGSITISPKKNQTPGLIIDGQHRVKGSASFSGTPPIKLCVVALLGADPDEVAFQFLVINNKAMKVSRDHLKNLNLQYDQDSLAERLSASAGLGLKDATYTLLQRVDREPTSPFFQILSWPTNAKKWVAPQAIELAYQQIEGEKRELKGSEIDFFLSIWSTIKEEWPDQWKEPDADFKLLGKVSIFALTSVVANKLFRWSEHPVARTDLRVDAEVRRLTKGILANLNPLFWSSEWKLKELDTALGRTKLKEAIQAMYDNIDGGLPWNYEIPWVIASTTVTSAPVIKKRPVRVPAKKAIAKSPSKAVIKRVFTSPAAGAKAKRTPAKQRKA